MFSCSSLAVASDGDHLDSEVVSLNSDDLKQQEEDFRRKIELEAEERKLEETLEYQKLIENEAKQKHLIELNNKKNLIKRMERKQPMGCMMFVWKLVIEMFRSIWH